MGQILKKLVKEHGYGIVMAAVALDGYRRTVNNDVNSKRLEDIRAQAKAAAEKANDAQRAEYQKNIAEMQEKTKNSAVSGRFVEAAEEHKVAVEAYSKNPTEYRQAEIERAKQKLDKSFEEVKSLEVVKEIQKSSLFEYINSFYNNYTEYLDSLTPDKIVCVFNIIIGGLTLSSFVSVLSIMLSENIINRIKFLDRFPKILAILKLRNNINKGIAKVYLIIHLVLILGGILSNIYMLFL